MANLSGGEIAKGLEAERVYVSLWVDQLPYHVHFVLAAPLPRQNYEPEASKVL